MIGTPVPTEVRAPWTRGRLLAGIVDWAVALVLIVLLVFRWHVGAWAPLVVLGWFTLCTWARSPGMALTGIRVADSRTGHHPRLVQAGLRSAILLACSLVTFWLAWFVAVVIAVLIVAAVSLAGFGDLFAEGNAGIAFLPGMVFTFVVVACLDGFAARLSHRGESPWDVVAGTSVVTASRRPRAFSQPAATPR